MSSTDVLTFRGALAGNSGRSSVATRLLSACRLLQTQGVPPLKLPDWDALATRSVDKAQRFFSRLCAASLFSSLLGSSDVPARARLRSCSGVGAGAFLLCLPSETDGTELADAVFTHAVRWRLGLPVCAADLFCCRTYSGDSRRQCGCSLDRLGDHLVCCGVGGFKTFLHSRVVAVLRSVLRDSGALVPNREVFVAGWGTASGEAARLEIEFTVTGVRRYVDVVVKHPRARDVVATAADLDGAAAAKGKMAKLRRYSAVPELGLDTVLSFGVESFGRLDKSALRLLRSAKSRVEQADGRFGGWLGHSLLQRWHAQLSCALVGGLWDSAAASFGFTGARVGLFDDVLDFRR